MKKRIIPSVILTLILLVMNVSTAAFTQAPAPDDTPTFYRLVPGTYVNGWPRFTVRYPKDWVERRPMQIEAFRASAPGPGTYPAFMAVSVLSYPVPLDKLTDGLTQTFKTLGFTDVTLVSDKPAQLRDGTPAREIEFKFVGMGTPRGWLALDTKKGDLIIQVHVSWPSTETGERLKAILYSIEFEPDKDEPLKVPPDVQALLDRHCRAAVAHDLAQVMANYSDGFLYSGVRKGEIERFQRQLMGRSTSFEIVITDLDAASDKIYLTGFVSNYFGRMPLMETSIIKENGEWKWFGNQRNPAP